MAEIRGLPRQPLSMISLLGVEQLCIGVYKMDCNAVSYKQARAGEIAHGHYPWYQ